MIGRDSDNDRNGYGVWPHLGGVAVAGVICAMMFVLAKSIG
jgi:hypothetical protein